MSVEIDRIDVRLLTLAPELAAAIVAAQRAAGTIPRDGVSQQTDEQGNAIRYSSADAIGAAASAALNNHGAAWVRLGSSLHAPALNGFDLGRQEYAGDVHTEWMIVHESGAAIVGTSEMPIIVSRGRPHDKATAASSTYESGGILRGALCLEREGKHSIDARGDAGDSRGGEEPLCVGKAAPIADSNKARCEELATIDGADKHDVWAYVCKACDVPKGDEFYPGPAQLYVSEGTKVGEMLKRMLADRHGPGSEPNQDPAGAP